MIKLSDLFNLQYGNNLALLDMTGAGNNEDYVNFISRTSQNNGVVAKVKRISGVTPFKKGLLTVAVSGSVLETFVQDRDFYTAYHVMVLEPKTQMTFLEKQFYAMCIRENKFRYNYGRQANRTLKELEIPSKVPEWVYNIKSPKFTVQDSNNLVLLDHNIVSKSNIVSNIPLLNVSTWEEFKVGDIFKCELGTPVHLSHLNEELIYNHYIDGLVPYVTRSAEYNGISAYLAMSALENGNCITIGAEGAKAFYQRNDFISGNKINKIYHPNLNEYNSLFICTILNLAMEEKFSYGRAVVLSKLKELVIKLPANIEGDPDWEYMTNYIKSLPYSSYI